MAAGYSWGRNICNQSLFTLKYAQQNVSKCKANEIKKANWEKYILKMIFSKPALIKGLCYVKYCIHILDKMGAFFYNKGLRLQAALRATDLHNRL